MPIPILLSILFLATGSMILRPDNASGGNPPPKAHIHFEGSLHYGYLWAHAGELRHLSRTHFPLFQLSVSRVASGEREWHGLYNYPEIGMSFMAGDMGYPEVLGISFALFPHLRVRLHEKGHFRLNLRYGLGAAYLTKPFHPTGNYRNNAIGSHLNIAFHSRMEAGVAGAGGSSLLWGLGLTHFSNGAFRKPNKGINIPTISLTYSFPASRGPAAPLEIRGHADPPASHAEAPEQPAARNDTHGTGKSDTDGTGGKTRRITAVVFLAGGASGIYSAEKTLYPATALAATTSLTVSPRWRLGLGADLFFNAADLARKNLNGVDEPGTHRAKGGVHLSYEQVFGRMDFLVQTGIYVADPYKLDGPLYNRLGFRYTLPGNWVMHLCLKTHTFKASFVEIGTGYRFFNQP